jgi:hypothetical protein
MPLFWLTAVAIKRQIVRNPSELAKSHRFPLDVGQRMAFSRLILVLAALSLSACAAMEPVAPGTRPIILDTSYYRVVGIGVSSVVFPKGVYQPSFQTADGVFYEAPVSMLATTAGIQSMQHGGLFIPNDRSGMQCGWFEQTSRNRYWFREPIPYHH